MPSPQMLPLFPLHTVLFPGGYLPLRIFETRYIDMVRSALRESRPFGVVLIKEGEEVQAHEGDAEAIRFYPIGTSAKIFDTDLAADGMLHIDTQGQQRFRVERSWVERDGLLQAEITWIDDVARVEPSPELDRLTSFLRRILLDEAEYPSTALDRARHWDDPAWVVYRLTERLPIKFEDRQRVLSADRLDLAVRHLSQMIAAFE